MKSQYSYLRARRFMRKRQLGLYFATVLAGTSAVASPVSLTYTGSIQTFTIPTTGMYLLSAAGAAGGGESAGSGGLGAVGSGSVFLNAGTELDIVVGGEGGSILNAELNGLAFPPAGAGGGGTFLFVVGASDPLLVAGGGGGWARDSTTGGQAGTAGASGEGGGGAGGTGGQGGAGAADSSGAGAGWLSNGGGVTSGLCLLSGPAQGGQSGPTFAGGIGASDGTVASTAGSAVAAAVEISVLPGVAVTPAAGPVDRVPRRAAVVGARTRTSR